MVKSEYEFALIYAAALAWLDLAIAGPAALDGAAAAITSRWRSAAGTTTLPSPAVGAPKDFDADGDGAIDPEELRFGFAKFGERMSDAEVDAIFVQADADGDGGVDYHEFAHVRSVVQSVQREADKADTEKYGGAAGGSSGKGGEL